MITFQRHWPICLIGFAGLLLLSCGSPGPPQPPSLELPRAVTDLRATRKADRVTLIWTVPTRTTDLQTVRHLGPTAVCRSLRVAFNQCGQPVGQVPPSELMPHRAVEKNKPQAPVQITYVDTLPQSLIQQHPLEQARYAVETRNPSDRSAGLSNEVEVPLLPTLPAPHEVNAKVTADGVVLNWTGELPATGPASIRYVYRIYRRDEATKRDAVAGEIGLGNSPQAGFTDRGFEWQKAYQYWVTAVTLTGEGLSLLQVEGADSASVQVVATDVFPPAVPSGVQAVASGVGQQAFIDLTWPPVSDADLAGYNVYRHEEGQEPVKINTALIKAPAFRDTGVQPGHSYFYSVSAVDVRGNESGRSQEANETVPSS